jgi:hypothetical protein
MFTTRSIIAATKGPLKCLTGLAESPIDESGKTRHFATFLSGVFPAASPPCRCRLAESADRDPVWRRTDTVEVGSDRGVTKWCLSGWTGGKERG